MRKKLIIISGIILLVIIVGVALLIGLSNRIVKRQLEQTLGADFKVEGISLSWGNVQVYGPKFLKDGETVAYARSIVLKADFFSLLKSGLSVSSLVLEEPSVKLSIGPDGELVIPIAIGKKQEGPSSAKPFSLSVSRFQIKNGTFVIQDQRLPAPNSVEAAKVDLTLDNLSVPFKDASSHFTLRTQLGGKLTSGLITCSGTFNLVKMSASVKFEGQNLVLLDTGSTGPTSRIENISFTASSEGIPEKPLLVSDVVLTKPYLRVETDRNGSLVIPVPGPEKKQPAAPKHGTPALHVEAKNIKVTGGEVLYLDGKISRPPFPIRIIDIAFNADYLSFPGDEKTTTFQSSCRIPGNKSTGVLTASGKTTLKALDTTSKISVRDLDLTSLKPYIVKKGDVDISRGSLDLSTDLNIRKKVLDAPTHAVIKNLEFAPGKGVKDQFLGIPRSLVMKGLATNNNQIALDFVVQGSLENPTFSFTEGLVTRFTVGLAKNLGLSAIESGQTVIIEGGRAIQGVGKGLKGIGSELQKLFK